MNDVAVAVALATAPSSAFRELRERPRFWLPLVLLVVGMAAINYCYYTFVDLDWLKDLMFSHNPRIESLPPDQRAAALGMMTRTTLLWSSVVGSVIAIPIIFLIEGFFLWLAAKITKVSSVGFKHWYTMAAWASLPMLLNFIVGGILLALSDTPQVSPSIMQSPLSINELLIHLPPGSPGQAMLDTLGIPTLLTWLLMIIGVRTWTQRSWLFSTLFVTVPSLVIYAVWAVIAFH